jgi:hypothetical protein
MNEKLKGTAPVALAVGLVAFVYLEFALNFTFHWVTEGNLGNGLSLPAHFHLAVPAAFVAWGMFFVLGADIGAARKVAVNSAIGCLACLVLMIVVTNTKGLPDFWMISLTTGVLGFVLVMMGVMSWVNVPTIFTAFASAVFWWTATGLDGWAPHGGGIGKSLAALSKPATAGAGAFGGVISTPMGWVVLNVFVTLVLGVGCGLASVKLAAVFTPKPAAAPVPEEAGAAATT